MMETIVGLYEWTFDNIANGNEFIMFGIVLNVYSFAVYWVFGTLFTILDLYGFDWAVKFKVQPGTNQPVAADRLFSAIKRCLFNQVVVATVFIAVFAYVGLKRGMPYKIEDLPDLGRVVRDSIIILLCEEIGFFYSHKWFHEYPSLYKRFHKIHHEWTAPIAITAIYAHPVEHILANLGPVALGPLVSGCHLIVVFGWITIAQITTLISHSGYHFPFLTSPEAHDFHHLKFNVNYGTLGILDHLYGTNQKFLNDAASDRHQTFFGLTPMRVLYPDRTKQA